MALRNNSEAALIRAATTARVNIAFDLDGPTGGALMNGSLWQKPGYFVLGAQGPERSLPRILDILQDHQINATFFVPTWVMQQWPDACHSIAADGHELAAHGHKHEVFHHLDTDEQAAVLARSQDVFRDVMGISAQGFRAPSGDLPIDFYELLRDNGYSYSSSMRSGDEPYIDKQTGIVEIPTKSLFDDYGYFAYHRAPNFPTGLDRISDYERVFAYWLEEVDAAADEGLTISTIWHPKVIGTPGRCVALDQMLGQLAGSSALRLMTAAAIARETETGE